MTDKEQPDGVSRQRIDKWLFFARLAKSRSIAQARIASGQVKVNGSSVSQSSKLVGPGDRLEISVERRTQVVVIQACGARRGPYEEARTLYEDVTPADEQNAKLTLYEQAQRSPGAGRPTKKERRAVERLLGRDALDDQ